MLRDVFEVRDDLAPSGKSRPQALNNLSRFELLGGGNPPLLGGRAVERAERIDKSDEFAAAQDELVERVLGGVR